MTWSGEVYALAAGEPARHLFSTVGMNVARCERVGGRWHLTSRELMFYLDPSTGRRLDRWTSSWTGQSVPVVHVANRVVQFPLAGPVPLEIGSDGVATLALDIPVSYPNPLARDPATAAFSPAATYAAHEHFTFVTQATALRDPRSPTVPALSFTWQRVGPWLPWMDLGARPGVLVYSARGRKIAGVHELPAVLRGALAAELPLYRSAPRCIVDARNETSWTYFARHVDSYRDGARFPLPAPIDPEECAPGRRRAPARQGGSSFQSRTKPAEVAPPT